MKYLIPALLASTCLAGAAHAQTVPTIGENCVNPTTHNPVSCRSDFANAIGGKQDQLGYSPLNKAGDTMTGALNIPHGTGGVIAGEDLSASTTLPANGATNSRANSERFASWPEPQDFLGSGQTPAQLIAGSIDIGPLVNAAITAGVRVIRIPCGTYKLATQIVLVNGVKIEGAGWCTIVSITVPTGDMVLANAASWTTLRDFRLEAGVMRTAGAAIYLQTAFHTVIDHVYLTDASGATHFDGLHVDGANDTHVNDMEASGGNGNGLIIDGARSGIRAEDTYVSHTNIASWENGIVMQWASGTYLDNMDVLNSQSDGIIVNPTGGEVDSFKAVNVLSDSNQGEGWSFAGTGTTTEVSLINCWGATNGYVRGTLTVNAAANGLSITNPNVNNFTLADSEFHGNTANGVYVGAGQNIKLANNAAFHNNNGNDGTASGFLIDTNSSYVQVIGNNGGTGGITGTGTVNHQVYGLHVVSTNYITAIGNLFQGDVTGGVLIPTSANVVNVGNGGS